MSIMLEEKVCQFGHKLGIWPTVTELLLTNAMAKLSCINNCGSSSCLVIKTESYHPDMIENLFRVCGITTNDSDKVRNNEFLKKIINYVKDKLADEEEELEDKDPFSFV